MRKTSLRILWLFAAIVVVATACSRVPGGVIPPSDMAELLADIHEGEGVAETERSTFSNDSMLRVLRESIYRRHGVTQEQVDSSMMWYGKNIEKYMDVYDRVIEILEKRLAKANATTTTPAHEGDGYLASQSTSLEGDSIDVWTLAHHRRFYRHGGNNFITYNMARDRNWQSGDNYTLRFKSLSPHNPVSAAMRVEYTDGSTEYHSKEYPQKGWNILNVATDPDKEASKMIVVIEYDQHPKEVMYIDSISLIRQHRRTRVQRPIDIPADTTRKSQAQ